MVIFDQSAVIPYRKVDSRIEIMLVSTRQGNWTIPKGIIEDDLTPQSSAAKEALEEAGITGKVKKKKVGTYKYNKWGGTCTAKVYKMKVEKIYDKWDEDNVRIRMWIPLDSASKFILKKKLLTIINNAFFKNNSPSEKIKNDEK